MEKKNQSIGEIRDYLKSNCRRWENDCDNYDDTVSLTNHIHDKYPKLTFEEIFDVVKDWTGYEEEIKMEIFDKNGKALHIADVIYSFIKNVAKENDKDIEDVLVGVDVGFPKGKVPVWIYTTEPLDNGYDALYLNDFGKPVKVNCI